MDDLLYERIFRFLSGRQKRAVEATDDYALGSTVGSVRSRNEDVAAVVTTRYGAAPHRDYTLAIVCDGMGGMADGRRAAMTAASAFIARMLQSDRFGPAPERLRQALSCAQEEVLRELQGNGGTTLSAVYIDDGSEAWLAHVGDSRVSGVTASGALVQLSRDDTIGAALKRGHERRPDSNRLIQYIGAEDEPDPQLAPINRDQFAGFLLTSDGAHGAPPEVLSTLAQYAKSPQDLVRKLLSLADVLGGLDNATAVYAPSVLAGRGTDRGGDNRSRDSMLATVFCPSGEHDIWMPRLGGYEESGRAFERTGLPAAASPLPKPVKRASAAKPKANKKRKSGDRTGEESRAELPLDIEKPVAKLDFSDGDGDAS